jgi:hypothetical protein
MPRCRERLASDPLHVNVAPAVKPGTPELLPPCADSVDVHVSNLERGARVTLTYRGQTYHGMAPPSASSFVFRLSPLAAGETITARQERCGIPSDEGSVTVPGVSMVFAAAPDLIDPLVGCARVVRATTIPGAWVQVWANGSGGATPISPATFATADSTRIEVTPYLHEGQDVWLSYLLCGAAGWTDSRHHMVQATPDVRPAEIVVPLVDGATSVTIDGIPGAAVNVYAMTGLPIAVEHIGSGFVDPLVAAVAVTRPITQRDLVHAEQRLCSGRPGVGAFRTVLPAVRQFVLGAPLKRLSHRNDPKPLVCQLATVILRHNGSWEFTALVENQETEADCSFDLQFDLIGLSTPFGAVLPGDLSAKDSTSGSAIHGIPSSRSFSRQDHFAGFRDPAYWEQVLGATHKFDLFVAWNDYEPTPEEPDSADDD